MTTPAPADSSSADTSADTSGDDGTDQDFPVETDEEKEEREAQETKEENDEVEKDYKNAFDQSEDFNPDQVDSEYGLDNYYQSGQNDFDNVYQEDIDNELAQLQMHGAVSIYKMYQILIPSLDRRITGAKGQVLQQHSTIQKRKLENQLPYERWHLQSPLPDDPALEEPLRVESQEVSC